MGDSEWNDLSDFEKATKLAQRAVDNPNMDPSYVFAPGYQQHALLGCQFFALLARATAAEKERDEAWHDHEIALLYNRNTATELSLRTAERDAALAELARVKAERDGLRQALQFSAPTSRFERQIRAAWNLLCRFGSYDWLDDPTVLRRALDGFVEEARDMTLDPAALPFHDKMEQRRPLPTPPKD
jgi:hypothetical protein